MAQTTQSARGDRQNAWKMYFKFILNIFLVFLILTCLLIIIFQFLNRNSSPSDLSSQNNQEIETLSRSLPSPKPIPHGPKAFNVSGGLQNAPQFSEGEINPYDPEQGTNQKIQIKITSQTPVQKATTTMITDNKQKEINMELIDGTNVNGTWQAEWQIDDTYLYTYKAKIKASSSQGTQVTTLTLR